MNKGKFKMKGRRRESVRKGRRWGADGELWKGAEERKKRKERRGKKDQGKKGDGERYNLPREGADGTEILPSDLSLWKSIGFDSASFNCHLLFLPTLFFLTTSSRPSNLTINGLRFNRFLSLANISNIFPLFLKNFKWVKPIFRHEP